MQNAKRKMQNNNSKYKTKNGFTLIEFLVYSFIVGLIFAGVVAVVWNILGGSARTRAMEEVSHNTRFALERISFTTREATAINIPLSPGTVASTLSLEMRDVAKNPTIFNVAGGILRMQEGIGAPIEITSALLNVTIINFRNLSPPGSPGTVRVEMTIEFRNPEKLPQFDVKETFYTTINI